MARSPYVITAALVAIAPLVACSDDAGSANLGVVGASCQSSPECRAPLQCLQNVCVDPSDPASSDAIGADATSGEADDAAVAADTWGGYAGDAAPEIVTAYDVADWEFSADGGPGDAWTPADGSVFDDCGELGVANTWSGTFVGAIDYDLAPNPLVPETGTLPVDGVLEFEITCIETKFVVAGLLDGTATVVGQGDFPFTLELRGTYNPVAKTMSANMVNGVVTIYGFIEVYFEGDFVGAIQPNDNFVGTWDGESSGTNQELVTGTAEGEGVWGAGPVF